MFSLSSRRWILKSLKTAATNWMAGFIMCPHTLSTEKIQEAAASKITQQKGSVNYKEDSI